MIIKDIECFLIRVPYRYDVEYQNNQNDKYNAAKFKSHELESLILKITTNSGIIGWGEAFGHACNTASFSIMTDLLIPFFKHKSCDDHLALMEQANYAFHSYGRGGTLFYALSAFDIALWDITAKKQNKPLFKLFGSTQQSIRLYPSLPCFDGNIDKLNMQLTKLYQEGFKYIKLHETNIDTITYLKHILPNDLHLMVDVNCALPVQNIVKTFEQLSKAGIDFVEEPIFPPESWRKLSNIKQQTDMKIALGENINNISEFDYLIESKSVDILQPSVCKIGGITPILKLLEKNQNNTNIQLIPHCYYYGPGMLATAHIVAHIGSESLLEVPYLHFKENLYPILNYQPIFTLPDTAGLGYEPNEQVMKDYLIKSTRDK